MSRLDTNKWYSYPRINASGIEAMLEEWEKLDLPSTELIGKVETETATLLAPGRIPQRSTGVTVSSNLNLKLIRTAVIELAREYGYPAAIQNKTDFDRACSQLISQLPLYYADVSDMAVWCHFNGWLLAPVTIWRWKFARERFGIGPRGRVRNQLGRLWWAGTILGDLYWDGKLGADQLTAILERPSIGGSPDLAYAITEAWLSTKENASCSSEDLMRKGVKALRWKLATTSLRSLSLEELRAITLPVFESHAR